MRAVALANHEQNGRAVSEALDVPVTTLSMWRRHPELQDPLERAIADKDIIQALDALAWRVIDTMPAKMEDASLSQLAHALSVTIDKAQLLRGAPTSIPGKPIDPDTLRARIRDILLDKAKQEAQDIPLDSGPGGSTQETVPSAGEDREGTEPGYLPEGGTVVTSGDPLLDEVDGTLGVTSGVLELE